MAFPEDAFSELSRVCQSLSRSIEARNLPDYLHELPVRDLHRFQQAIDYLRKPLNLSSVRRHRDDPGYLQRVLRDFIERLEEVRANPELHRLTSQVPFRIVGTRNHRYGEPILHEALLRGNINIEDALRYLADSVSALPLDLLLSDGDLVVDEDLIPATLGRVLPREQVPAPAQFRVDGGRVRIAHQAARTEARDEQNAASAQKELLERGQQIIADLRESNCDPRLISGLEELQARIESNEDIIRTGITNITCSHLFEQSKNELPDALYGLMQGHSVSVNMYVGQFPEWRRFAEQAATAAIEPEHIPHISAAANRIADELSDHPELADPEVPRLLKLLSELVSDPGKANRRAAFAVLRTIENLVLSVYTIVSDLLTKTASKTVDGLSTIMSRLIVIAVAGAILLGPVARAIPEVSWVKQATEIVIHELRNQGIKF